MTHITEVLAVCGLFVWTMVIWRGGTLLVRELKQCINSNHFADGVLIVLGVSGNVLNMIYELGHLNLGWPNYEINLSASIKWIGVCLYMLGFAWVSWSRRTLGTAWTVVPQSPGGGLITKGPYAFVRHPIYSGAIVVYTGLLLAQGNATGCFIFGAQVTGFIIKALREDRLLGFQLPEYETYKRIVRWKLFPGFW